MNTKIHTTFEPWTVNMLSDADRARITTDLATMLEGGHPSKEELPDGRFPVYPRWSFGPDNKTVTSACLETASGSGVARAVLMCACAIPSRGANPGSGRCRVCSGWVQGRV